MVQVITDNTILNLCEAGLETVIRDPVLREMMAQSNKVSLAEQQVEHGYSHALDVFALTKQIIEQMEAVSPGLFSRFFILTALLAALLHDVGRIKGSKDHDKNGAVIARRYLETILVDGKPLPRVFINRVVFIVRNHRAESWLNTTRKREFDGPDVVAVILSDKLCGTEARVPEELLNAMKLVAGIFVPVWFRKLFNVDEDWSLARIPWNRPDLITPENEFLTEAAEKLLAEHGVRILPDIKVDFHDMVNGSIYQRSISISDGILRYAIKVDLRLASRELVTGLDWWHDALHLSSIAAAYLGLRFQLEFNGQLLGYDKAAQDWLPVEPISA